MTRAEIVPGAMGEPIVRLALVLDDPPPDLRTWPLNALRAMETLAWDEAAPPGISEWVYVKHRLSTATRDGLWTRPSGRSSSPSTYRTSAPALSRSSSNPSASGSTAGAAGSSSAG